MIAKDKIVSVLVLMAMFFLYGYRPAGGGEVTERVRSAVNQGVEILNRARLDGGKDKTRVIDRLREIVYPLFDFKEMAARSLGAHWRRLDPQQQKIFVSVFTRLLEKTYADKIDLYDEQKVIFRGEDVDGKYATVKTQVVGGSGRDYSVDYRLHLIGGKWKIYDVIAQGISIVNNYRSQFNRVLASSSFEELIKRMKEKAA